MLALIFLSRIQGFCYFWETIYFFSFYMHALCMFLCFISIHFIYTRTRCRCHCHCGRKSIQFMSFVSNFMLLDLIFSEKFLERFLLPSGDNLSLSFYTHLWHHFSNECHCGRNSIQFINFISILAMPALIFLARILDFSYFWETIFFIFCFTCMQYVCC